MTSCPTRGSLSRALDLTPTTLVTPERLSYLRSKTSLGTGRSGRPYQVHDVRLSGQRALWSSPRVGVNRAGKRAEPASAHSQLYELVVYSCLPP